MWVGGTEKNIAECFRQAETDGAILLIDEIEGFLQDRREARHSWEITGVNEMLTQMESFPGIFIASTNLRDNLDQAALRRFDMKIKFDYLLPHQSRTLLESYCDTLHLEPPDTALNGASRPVAQPHAGRFCCSDAPAPVQTGRHSRRPGVRAGRRVQSQGKLQTSHRVLLILSPSAISQCGD